MEMVCWILAWHLILFSLLHISTFLSYAAAMQMLFFSAWHLPGHLRCIFWKDIIHKIVIYTKPASYLLHSVYLWLIISHLRIFLGSKDEWCFMCEMEKILIEGKRGKSPVSPTGILCHFNEIGIRFDQGKQEDAHEFLRWNFLFHLTA